MVLTARPLDHVVAQLGVLKSGHICVPVDVAFPASRQARIHEDSGARLILTTTEHRETAAALPGAEVLAIDTLESLADDPLDQDIPPGALAYLLYTSGTTGRPKGTMQPHRNLLHVAMLYHTDLGIGAADRVTSPTSPAYTGTIWALLGSLLNGAAFVATTATGDLPLLDQLARHRITVAQIIVSLLRQFMRTAEEPLPLPDLRLVYTGGESLHREDVRQFAAAFPEQCRLLYDLGSTESGIMTHLRVDLDAARGGHLQQEPGDPVFPVGYPVADTSVLILDERGQPLPSGEEGEIGIRGAYISPGYWNAPLLTADRFIADPDGSPLRVYRTADLGRLRHDGALLHLGRRDFEVKVRGRRVNLMEVEEAMLDIADVAAAAATASDEQGTMRIVGYVQPRAGAALKVDRLQSELRTRLPPHAIPAAFVFLERFPMTPNGKLDRARLPCPERVRPNLDEVYVAPRSNLEQDLARIWSEVLDVDGVGVHDDFFALGGQSLAAMQIVSRIARQLGIEVPVKLLFDAPTVEALAAELAVRRS